MAEKRKSTHADALNAFGIEILFATYANEKATVKSCAQIDGADTMQRYVFYRNFSSIFFTAKLFHSSFSRHQQSKSWYQR